MKIIVAYNLLALMFNIVAVILGYGDQGLEREIKSAIIGSSGGIMLGLCLIAETIKGDCE